MEVVTTAPAAPVIDIKALLHSTAHAPEALQLVEEDQAATVPQSSDTLPKSTGGAAPGTPAISVHELDYEEEGLLDPTADQEESKMVSDEDPEAAQDRSTPHLEGSDGADELQLIEENEE